MRLSNLIMILGLAAPVSAERWILDVTAGLGATLNAYSQSWTGGDAGLFSWTSQFLGVGEKQLSPWLNTRSTLKLQFGQTELQDKTTKHWDRPQKSIDLIDALEVLRFSTGWWAEPFASARLISQFVDASDTTLTRYVNPLNITEAAGFARTLKKTAATDWTARLGPALQQFIDRQRPNADGTRSTFFTNDAGVVFDMDYGYANTGKWATLLSSLRVFEAVFSSKAGEMTGAAAGNGWRNPRVFWENTGTLSYAKYFMLTGSFFLYYDTQVSPSVRVKETVAVGLTYTFSQK